MTNNKKLLVLLILVVISIVLIWFAFNSPIAPNTEVMEQSQSVIQKHVTVSAIDKSVPSNTYLHIAIAFLSLATFIAVSISFYLYKWRRILLSKPNAVVPEEWSKYLRQVGVRVDDANRKLVDNMEWFHTAVETNTKKISNMTTTYMELQSVLDEKDKEIRRLKEGYDAEIFRKFILRFARIDQAIDDYLIDGGENESLIQLKRLFEDAFDECGVSKYKPVVGEDYRKAIGVSDSPKIVLTDNPEDEFLIAEVLESGYQLNSGIVSKVIIPSKVRIYKIG